MVTANSESNGRKTLQQIGAGSFVAVAVFYFVLEIAFGLDFLQRPANGSSPVSPIIVGRATEQVAELHQAMLADRARATLLEAHRIEMAKLQRESTAVLKQLVVQSKRQADTMEQVNARAARAHDRGLSP